MLQGLDLRSRRGKAGACLWRGCEGDDVIRAHMATYPERRDVLEASVRSLAGQVDRLFLVLNEFDSVPPEIARIDRVEPILPDEDLKDVGKFLPRPDPEDLVFLADDDILYGEDYVVTLMAAGAAIGLDGAVVGLHGSLYTIAAMQAAGAVNWDRQVWPFHRCYRKTRCVDQLGSGAMLTLGRNLAPLSHMLGSQKFVDVRYAAWLQARGVSSWCIARAEPLAGQLVPNDGQRETIFETFTQARPADVTAEILSFAGKGKRLGEVLQ